MIDDGPKNGTSQPVLVTFLSISTRIKEERERLGFSQTQFAALADASKKTQIRWEQEDGAAPDARALSKWIVVGLDALYVLTGERANTSTSTSLPADEQLLVEAYRGLTPLARKALLADLLTSGKKPRKAKLDAGQGVAVSGSGNRVAGRDFNERKE